jgi:PAS domain S-box-containing protein
MINDLPNIKNKRKTKNTMHKQLKQLVAWIGRKRVLLFVLIFSVAILGAVIYHFAEQDNWLKNEFAKQVQNIELNKEITVLSLYIKSTESAERGYVISGNRVFVEKFDAGIDSIRAIYKQVQQLANRNKDDTDAVLFLASDSLVKQKIAFMQRVKKLCDNNDCMAAATLIATNQGEKLSDSIALINRQINVNIQQRLKKSQREFSKTKSNNSNLTFSGIIASMLLIILVFSLLFKALRKTKKISDELYLRKENYRVTLNSLGEGLISTDEKGRITYMNPSAEQLTGWRWQDAKDQLLHQVFDVVNEQTGKPIEHIVSRILKDGKKIDWENNTVLKAKNNAEFIISNNGSAIFDVDGHTSGAVLLFNDITEKYKIERQLKDSERQYRDLIQNLPEAVYTCDAFGYIKLYNKAAVKLWGRKPVAGKDLWCGSWKIFKTDGTDLPLDSCPMAITLKEGMPVHGKEILVQRPDESFRHVLPYPSPLFNAEGKLTGAINMLIDVTDRKEREILIQKTEEKYRNLIEQASDAILIYSFDGTIYEFNKTCYTMLGYSKEEYAKLRLTDILVDDIIVNQDNYAAILAGETKTLNRKLMRKDGSLLETEVTVKVLADGKVIAFARDVTERKKAEQALKESEIFNRSILTSIDYHIAVVEENGNIISVNKAWVDFSVQNGETALERTGIGSNYVAVCKISAKAGDSLAAKALHGFEEVVKKEIPFFEMEYPCNSVDEQRWFLLRIVNFSDDSPKVVMMHIDITELKKAGEEITKNEQRYRALVEHNDGIIAMVDENFKIIYRSPSAIRITGWTDKESRERGTADIIHPEDMPLLKKLKNDLMNNPGKLQSIAFRTRNKNDNYIFIEGTAINLLHDENVKAIVTNVQDVTERVEAEKIIKKEKELSDSVINSLPGVFYFYDEDLKLLRWNKQLENVTGYSAAELKDMSLVELFTDKDTIYMQERIRKVFANGSGDAEANFTTKSGKKIPFYFTSVRMQYDGKPTLLGIGIDITERKIAEKEIQDYKLALDESSLVDISDSNGIIRYANENFCRISKYSKKELIGQDHRILDSAYHPKEFFQHLWKTVGEGKIWRNEVKNRAKDGSYFWVDTTIVPFVDNNGNPSQFITIRSDITKRKNAEALMAEAVERYDILADATSDTIWDWDIVNNTMLYNEGITKMFGYTASEVENVVDWWNEKLHSEDFQNVTDALEDVFEKKIDRLQFSYRFRCADGSYKYIFDRAFVIFDKDGKPIRMIGAMQDITYESEEIIRIDKATLDAQEQERNYLGAELHDNINQILGGTKLILSMAKSKEISAIERTKVINTAIGYISDAIDETRKLSHELAPASFEDNSLKDMFEKLLSTINLENLFTISLEFNELNVSVIPDNIKVNLYRILQEQTKNILKYSEASSIQIAVKIIDNAIILRIYDNGKGFDTKAQKTGIGLRNIKKRAETLYGKFILNSAPGQGCEIIVEIPLGN